MSTIGRWVVLSPRHTHGNGVGWELQRRGTLILMLDSGRKADSIGTHGRWREVPLVQILKEEWDFHRER